MKGSVTVHATAVAMQGRAVLIQGGAGVGKSDLALRMMALGADLIADDQVILTLRAGRVYASCPAALRGMIEARGIGLLRARPSGPAAVACVLDMDVASDTRLPPAMTVTLLGCAIPLHHPPPGLDLASAMMQFLRAGRIA